jgi:hypothetical protein
MTEIEIPGVPEEDEKAGGITALHHHLRKLILEGVYPFRTLLANDTRNRREIMQPSGVAKQDATPSA